MSDITRRRRIRSGSSTAPLWRPGGAFLILSTFSMPSTTRPQTVYLLSRKRAGAKVMKNWLSALSGCWARAMPTVPRR